VIDEKKNRGRDYRIEGERQRERGTETEREQRVPVLLQMTGRSVTLLSALCRAKTPPYCKSQANLTALRPGTQNSSGTHMTVSSEPSRPLCRVCPRAHLFCPRPYSVTEPHTHGFKSVHDKENLLLCECTFYGRTLNCAPIVRRVPLSLFVTMACFIVFFYIVARYRPRLLPCNGFYIYYISTTRKFPS